MNYATVVADMFSRFPILEAEYKAQFAYMGDDEPLPYMVFGAILVPALAKGLEHGDFAAVQAICAFLEDVSHAGHHDVGLVNLLQVEIGEWLEWAANEDRLAPWLGPETKRICSYVPGLATERRLIRSERQAKTIAASVSALIQHL